MVEMRFDAVDEGMRLQSTFMDCWRDVVVEVGSFELKMKLKISVVG